MVIEFSLLSQHSTLLGLSISQGMVQYPGSNGFSNYVKISLGAIFFTISFSFKKEEG